MFIYSLNTFQYTDDILEIHYWSTILGRVLLVFYNYKIFIIVTLQKDVLGKYEI